MFQLSSFATQSMPVHTSLMPLRPGLVPLQIDQVSADSANMGFLGPQSQTHTNIDMHQVELMLDEFLKNDLDRYLIKAVSPNTSSIENNHPPKMPRKDKSSGKILGEREREREVQMELYILDHNGHKNK